MTSYSTKSLGREVSEKGIRKKMEISKSDYKKKNQMKEITNYTWNKEK